MLSIVSLTICIAASVIIGLLVFARNPKHISNRLYALITVSLSLFAVFNYLSLNTDDRLLYIRLVVLFTTVAVAAIYYFIRTLAASQRSYGLKDRAIITVTAITCLLEMTPVVFSGLSEGINPAPIPNFGAVLFLAVLVFFPLRSALLLVNRFRHSKGMERSKYAYILCGIAPIFALAPLTGFILPVVFQNTSLIVLSPVYALFFVSVIGYVIVRHRLFDIRLVVARSIAYAGSVLFMASLYGLVVFALSQAIFDIDISIGFQIFMSLATAVVALSFPALKRFFDKASQSIFYRDAYDAELIYDKLNKLLVSTLNLDKLLKQTSEIIGNQMKADFCYIGLKEVEGSGYRVLGTAQQQFEFDDVMTIRKITVHMHKSVIATDYISEQHADLKRILDRNNVAVLVRLSPNIRRTEEGLGYLLLGHKKSGNPYNEEDFRVLETVANELIIAIQNALHFEQIQNFNTTLQEKITHATKQLRATNQRLKALDETKDDFISMASHQLRTPLTSVKGYLSMVVEGDAGDITPLQKQMLTQAYTSSQRMVYLISDLLNVSRLKTGKFVITPTRVSLADMVEEEVAQLKDTASGRGIGLIFDKPAEWPMTYLDDTKVRQVVMNFMDNAIYYTRPGGTVIVKLDETPDSIELTIKDDGIGVPKAEQRHLFTKFYRANNARQIRPDGTGLGLFMAKKVIVAQGGTLLFRSAEGKGSTFGFSFAKKTIAAPADDSGTVPNPIAVN